MIVMLNMVFGDRYQALREFASKRFPMRWISGFGNRPSMLFEGVEVRNTIFIGMQGEKQLNSAPMHRWVANYRPHLMSCIRYSKVPSSLDVAKIWPFITSLEIYNLLMSHNGALRSSSLSRGPKFELENGYPVWDSENGEMAPLFYISNARYWISAYTVVPPAEDGDGKSVVTTALNVLWFRTQELRDIAFTLLVSKWMFVWWAMFADDFNVTRETLLSFPIEIENIEKHQKKELVRLANMLQEKMISNVKWTKRTFPDKRVIKVGNWDISKCRDVLVEIDKVWSDILLANELEEELLFQYFSTVKTVSESSNDNVVEEI
jgi:hypothetical protein